MSLYLGTTPIANDGSHNTANVDLSNLSNTGEAHFANPALTNSPYTTNRILEIPQDIKLELNNGTVTLKAGSKVYVPNGFEADGTTPKFDAIVIPSDYVYNADFGINHSSLLSFGLDGTGVGLITSSWHSGTTAPTSDQFMLWYDTNTNKIKWTTDYGTTWTEWSICLPIARITIGDTYNVITSIDQVFNGLGYIGSTVFALPGVKTVVPNGRNADGTCKNHAPSAMTSVKTFTMTSEDTCYVFTNFVSSIITPHGYICSKTKPIVTKTTLWYNPETNLPSQVLSDGTVITPYEEIPIAKFTSDSTGRITSFEPFTVDSVVTSNASNFSQAGRSYLSGLGMPSGRYIDLTLGASNSTYTAPANGTVLAIKRAVDVGQNLGLARVSSGIFFDFAWNSVANSNIFVNMDVRKGEVFGVSYTASGTEVQILRFYYAEGEE